MNEDGYKDEQTLRELYEDERLSMDKIGDFYDVTGGTILYYMKKFDIERRDNRDYPNHGVSSDDYEHPTGEDHQNYVGRESRDCNYCGDTFRVRPDSVKKYCDKRCHDEDSKGDRRSPETEFKSDKDISEEEIRNLYWEQGLNLKETAKELGLGNGPAVKRWFEKYDIETRDRADALPRGEKHHNWKGGYSNYYGSNWKKKRKERLKFDDYTCQSCGLEGDESLHVHHHQPLNSFKEPEKANYLFNLITLCNSCHASLEGRRRGNE